MPQCVAASSGLGARRLVTGVIKVWRVGSEMWVDVGRAVAFNYAVQIVETFGTN